MRKNINIYLSLILIVITVLSFTSCTPGFKSSTATTAVLGSNSGQSVTTPSTPNTPDSNNPNTPVTPPADVLSKIDLKGVVDTDQSTYSKALAFDFDKVRAEFVIMIPMPTGVPFIPSGVFSKYPDITFSPVIDAQARMKLAMRIPIKYIIKGANFLQAASLPNGDALPMAQGSLPSLALNFPAQNDTKLVLYIGVNMVGLFVSLPQNIAIPFGFSFPIKNSDKTKTMGFLSYIPPKLSYAPGLFVSTTVPANISKVLEDYFKL